MVRGLGRGDAGRPTTCEFRRIALSLVVEMLSPRVAARCDARDRELADWDAIPPACGTCRLSGGGGTPPGTRFAVLDPAEDPT